MRKILSILFSALILLSGIHFSVATHYCNGRLVETKVSVTGEIASCGMESGIGQCELPGKHIGRHCCEDKVSSLAVDTNYTPSFSEFKVSAQRHFTGLNLPVSSTGYTCAIVNGNFTNASPPGNLMVSAVSLPCICVFRI